MSLADYLVPRDKFKEDEKIEGLAFPCNGCRYRNRSDRDEPCLHCDHNLGSEPEDE